MSWKLNNLYTGLSVVAFFCTTNLYATTDFGLIKGNLTWNTVTKIANEENGYTEGSTIQKTNNTNYTIEEKDVENAKKQLAAVSNILSHYEKIINHLNDKKNFTNEEIIYEMINWSLKSENTKPQNSPNLILAEDKIHLKNYPAPIVFSNKLKKAINLLLEALNKGLQTEKDIAKQGVRTAKRINYSLRNAFKILTAKFNRSNKIINFEDRIKLKCEALSNFANDINFSINRFNKFSVQKTLADKINNQSKDELVIYETSESSLLKNIDYLISTNLITNGIIRSFFELIVQTELPSILERRKSTVKKIKDLEVILKNSEQYINQQNFATKEIIENLEDQLHTITEERDQALSEKSALQQNLDIANYDLDFSKQSIEELNQTIDNLRTQLNSALLRANVEKFSANQEKAILEANIHNLEEQLQTFIEKQEALQQKLFRTSEEKDSEIQNLNQEINSLTDKLTAANQKLFTEKDKTDKKTAKLEAEISNLEAQLSNLLKEQHDLQLTLNQTIEEKNAALQKIEELNQEIDFLTKQLNLALQETRKEKPSLNQESIDRTIDFGDIKQRLKELKAKLQQDLNETTIEKNDLQQLLNEAYEDARHYQQSIKELNEEKDRLTEQLNTALQKLKESDQHKETQENIINNLKTQLQAITQERNSYRQTLIKNLQTMAMLNQKLEELQQIAVQTKNNDQELDQAKQTITDLKTKLENIHAEAAEAIIEEQQKRAKIESIIKDVLSDTLRFVSLDGEGSNEVISELIHGSNFLWMAKDLPNNLWLEIKKQAEDVTEHRYGLPSIPKGILPDSLESETEWRK